MFKALVKLLFPSIKKDNQPNFLYFEDSKKSTKDMQEQMVNERLDSSTSNSASLLTIEEKHQRAFYDFLFGQSPPTEQYDELSLFVANKIELLLLQPKNVLAALPVLPASLSKVLEQLNNKDFDIEILIDLIEQEPLIVAKVIELSNSSFYNRSGKVIIDLKSAFMLLGANGLMEGVINGFVSKMAPQPNIYFQQYGNKIWQHSLTTGIIAKKLISTSPYKKEAAQGYLIGLICNLGNMIIYQLLIEAFTFVHPDCQPNSFAFKELMAKNSKKLTYHIAKNWQFPNSILDALALQVKLISSSMLAPTFSRHPIACYIYEANLISELTMRFEHNNINEDTLNEAKTRLLFSHEAKHYMNKLKH